MSQEMREALDMTLRWLRAALDCKQFHWDADQHEAAEQTFADARAILAHPPHTIGEHEKLCELLRAERDSGRRTMGGGSLSSDGKCEMWGGEVIMARINPDGPEAATAIERLSAERASLSGRVEEADFVKKLHRLRDSQGSPEGDGIEATRVDVGFYPLSDALIAGHDVAARLALAERVIAPFAEAAIDIDETSPDHAGMWEHPASMSVTAADFRAAAQFLEAGKVEPPAASRFSGGDGG